MFRYLFFAVSFLSILNFIFSPDIAESHDTKIEQYLHRLGIQEFNSRSEAPDFSLLDINGRRIRLSEFRGKIVFLDIWATWCKQCIEEMPSIQTLHEKLKGDNFVVIAVSIDKEGMEVVRPYADKHGLTFHILLSDSSNISKSYWTWGIPSSYLIDREGRFIGRALGPRDWGGKMQSI